MHTEAHITSMQHTLRCFTDDISLSWVTGVCHSLMLVLCLGSWSDPSCCEYFSESHLSHACSVLRFLKWSQLLWMCLWVTVRPMTSTLSLVLHILLFHLLTLCGLKVSYLSASILWCITGQLALMCFNFTVFVTCSRPFVSAVMYSNYR